MVKCPSCGEENPPKFRLCGYCGAPLATAGAALPAHEVRKTVTIIFCDLKGSTALGEHLDAEALHEVKERYFNAMAAEISRHGGKIEKYIGDAIMAVFGLPRAHEDDALRAVRAVVGMQAALGKVNEGLMAHYGVALSNRTGVNTGEVVANDDPGADQKLATGDAVNVAARLEQAAPENQIYLGEVTYRLVRDAVEVEPVEPLELKGKAQRVPAFRLVSAGGLDGNVRRHDTPIVGRDEELSTMARIFREVAEGRAVRMVTVIGDAGVGKSRLVREVIGRIAAGSRVLSGRCLPYGDGITFWPLLMMVREAAGIRDADSPEAARSKLLEAVRDREVADRLASAAGLSTAAFPLNEINWAARKFFELFAASGPLVVFVDDIHWAEAAYLDLLEHVLQTSSGAPILLLATARHDVIDERPEWGTQPNAARIVLEPLSDDASALVVANLLGSADLPASVITRIVHAACGNPLYAEQMLSMLIDNGALRLEGGQWVRAELDSEIAVPPTIHALLEARLDKLARDERATVEPASVIGLEFPQPAVESLAPEAVRAVLPDSLKTLARKQFIHPGASSAGEAIYRFHHHLVRDTVYNGLLKRARATLHIEFVRWADRVNADRDQALQFEEILGYHLEQAHRYLSELGPLDERGAAIGIDAARRLAAAGRRAFARSDLHAAANLLKRATALLGAEDPQRAELLPELGETMMGLGDFAVARDTLQEARLAADRIGSQRIKASSQLVEMFIRLYSEPGESEEMLRMAHELIPVLEREAAHGELATAWRLIMLVHCIAGRYERASEAAGHSIAHARRAGNERLIARVSGILANAALLGPTPVPQAIEQCERIIAEGLSDRQVECNVMCNLAELRAMNGELSLARSLYQRGRAMLRDLGHHVNAAASGFALAGVESLGGDLSLAERELRGDYERLQTMGETFYLSSMAALLSRVLRDQGSDSEALVFSKRAEEATAADDLESQALWRAIRAPIVARAGQTEDAEVLAKTAVGLARQTESTSLQADALSELACVLRLAGRLDEARTAIDEAIALYKAKGNIVAAARAGAAFTE